MAGTLASVKRQARREQQQRTDRRVRELQVQYDQTTRALDKKGWERCSPPREQDREESLSVASRSNLHRKGKGVIDRLGFPVTEEHQEPTSAPVSRPAKTLVGPESGLPHPTPDPRYNPVPERTSRVVIESATWTGVQISNGKFEWSRVDKFGHQEWLVATEGQDGEWNLKKSVAIKR